MTTRILVNGEIVLGYTVNENEGVEVEISQTIKDRKNRVSIERLRYVGGEVIDMIDQPGFYVVPKNEGESFLLYCQPVLGGQWVDMHYQDRKRLTMENGVIMLKALNAELIEEYIRLMQSEISKATNKNLLFGTILIALLSVLQNNSTNTPIVNAIKALFAQGVPQLEELLSEHREKVEKIVKDVLPTLKGIINNYIEYQEEIENIVTPPE